MWTPGSWRWDGRRSSPVAPERGPRLDSAPPRPRADPAARRIRVSGRACRPASPPAASARSPPAGPPRASATAGRRRRARIRSRSAVKRWAPRPRTVCVGSRRCR
ncbi:hypothetical protein [Mycobacterium paraffinicum]|uniref:hypothetical protein n=1 Tax=Mycobacterium paraffinicum TaxID=53378 RepID=UPI003D769CBA